MATVGKSLRKSTPRKTTSRAAVRKPSVNGKRPARRSNHAAETNHKENATMTQREKLVEERAQVGEELARLRAELQEAPEATGDEVDLSVYDRERTLGLIANYELRLEQIDIALRAAEKGQYGICQRCGKPIDPERLRIFPETRHCVTCKTELETIARRSKIA